MKPINRQACAAVRIVRGSLVVLGLTVGFTNPQAPAAAMRAAVFTDKLPGHDESFAREIGRQVSAVGYAVEFVGVSALTNAAELSAGKFDLLVLAGARALPAGAAPAVENYLKQGGNLLALGLPAWESPLCEGNGHWLARASYEEAIAAQRPEKLLFDFATTDLRQWSRATDNPGLAARYERARSDGGEALHVALENLTGWDTFRSPPLTNIFPSDHTLTCFRARGTAHTKQLALEWTERDGSRWIATVDLTTEWKRYALPPRAFKAWEPPPARSGGNDGFRPQNASRFAVGLAHSHTSIAGAQQEYWFADLGTAVNPFGDGRGWDEFKPPHLESISPGYQFFPITTRAVIRAVDDERPTQAMGKMLPGATPGQLRGMHPRPRGVGFNQDRENRWQPLLAAYDAENGDFRGTIAALVVQVKPPYRGGVWAAFTPAEPDFYRQPVVAACLRDTLRRMRRGIFLVEGGTEYFTTFPEQNFRVGARVANFGRETVTNLSVSVNFDDGRRAGGRHVCQAPLNLAPGQIETVEARTSLRGRREQFVAAELRLGGKGVDQLRHEIAVWMPKAKPDFIVVRDGGLWRRGQPWKANGVNYMPSSGIGLANWRHFEHWVGGGAYDPEVIERDLCRMQAMNLNAVSVFIYHESLAAQHLLDFLRRCEAHGLHVNLSLRPGTPLDFRWSEMRELIEYYRLAQNDTVFAYDLAWEPRHEPPAFQSAYAQPWAEWVRKRHGDADSARKAWGVGVENFPYQFSDLNSLPAPPMKWFTQDGPWRKLVADYRLFLDDLLHEHYAEARRLVRSVDPNHAVSFRMQHAGDPTFNSDAFLPYDFPGLAGAVDIWEPEAYGRIGDWERVKPGRFTADYARLCDATKPVIWAEVGYSVWDNLRMMPASEKLDFQARYFRDFYRMMTESAADGIFSWWYPGGYRLNERSDFGILNPDGTDRPVTKIIRDEGAKFLTARKSGANPNHWMAVDRDRDPRGVSGIYQAVQEEYWRTIATGKNPGLRWENPPRGAAGSTP